MSRYFQRKGLASLEICHSMLAMQIISDAQLLEKVEAFIAKHNMAPSRFGKEVMGDPALVFQLREGRRSLSLKNAEKVVNFMRSYRAPKPAKKADAA